MHSERADEHLKKKRFGIGTRGQLTYPYYLLVIPSDGDDSGGDCCRGFGNIFYFLPPYTTEYSRTSSCERSEAQKTTM